ncbi:MAG TPA: response regulator transcription factor [Chitinophagaceae bacterium]|nr:response regulator transcription factor [Chitinophagaceae bacterium]
MQVTRTYRVAIFDDNTLLRQSLGLLINDDASFEVVGSFADCTQVIDDIETCSPDIIIMDINMPHINGIEAVKKIKAQFSSLPILMQTVFDDDESIFAAITAGANGYILKNAHPEKLLFALQEVMEGGAPMSPPIAKKVLNHLQSAHITNDDFKLNPRENEVIQHLVKGLPYKQIADKMNITYPTVRFHMKNIYAKLHVASMTEVVAKALQHKLFS